MRFMMLMIPKGYEKAVPGAMPDAKVIAAMMKYNEELQKAGVLLSLEGLHPPSMGARVSFPGGKPKVTALPRFGERDDRDPPGAGALGLPSREATSQARRARAEAAR